MKLVARVIIQMMGAPKKHIEQTLRDYIKRIEEDYADIKIRDKFLSKAKKDKSMFSVFAELELEIDGPENLTWFCFDYMPSSVEIVEPDRITYESREFTHFLNDLQQKLHKVDMALKNLSAENQVLRKNGVTLMRNLIRIQLISGPKTLSSIAKGAGAAEDQIVKFLDAMVKEGKILKQASHYRLP
jgi:hypothetical protein